jgi:hypothetical protein
MLNFVQNIDETNEVSAFSYEPYVFQRIFKTLQCQKLLSVGSPRASFNVDERTFDYVKTYVSLNDREIKFISSDLNMELFFKNQHTFVRIVKIC